jgi:hypothetical protein
MNDNALFDNTKLKCACMLLKWNCNVYMVDQLLAAANEKQMSS